MCDIANSPGRRKQAEAAAEAEQLFSLLCPRLANRWVGKHFQSLLNEARSVLGPAREGSEPGPRPNASQMASPRRDAACHPRRRMAPSLAGPGLTQEMVCSS